MKQGNPFVAIPASLGGITLFIVVLFLIFQGAQISLVLPIIWALVVLGCVSSFFAYLAQKKK